MKRCHDPSAKGWRDILNATVSLILSLYTYSLAPRYDWLTAVQAVKLTLNAYVFFFKGCIVFRHSCSHWPDVLGLREHRLLMVAAALLLFITDVIPLPWLSGRETMVLPGLKIVSHAIQFHSDLSGLARGNQHG